MRETSVTVDGYRLRSCKNNQCATNAAATEVVATVHAGDAGMRVRTAQMVASSRASVLAIITGGVGLSTPAYACHSDYSAADCQVSGGEIGTIQICFDDGDVWRCTLAQDGTGTGYIWVASGSGACSSGNTTCAWGTTRAGDLFCCEADLTDYEGVRVDGSSAADYIYLNATISSTSYSLTAPDSDPFYGEVYGFGGDDHIDGSLSTDASYTDVLYGGADVDWISGRDGDDFIYGESHGDHLAGGPDDDVIQGGAGTDWINGNEGADVLCGGEGDEGVSPSQFTGDSGDDVLFGGPGHDAPNGGTNDTTSPGDECASVIGEDDAAANCETALGGSSPPECL